MSAGIRNVPTRLAAATTGVAALRTNRMFVGCELEDGVHRTLQAVLGVGAEAGVEGRERKGGGLICFGAAPRAVPPLGPEARVAGFGSACAGGVVWWASASPSGETPVLRQPAR